MKRTTRHLAAISTAALRLQPDDRLVAVLREGHDRAFDEIVRRFRAPLVGFARGIVGPDRAEDVVQGALLRAYDALLAGDSRIVLRPWLYRIVRNGAISELRAARAHEHLDESFDGVAQPPELAEDRERFQSLVERLKELPPAQREALVRTELAGASHEEIAASLGTTPGGVRQLVFRARTALRDAAGLTLPMPVLRYLLSSSDGVATGAVGAGGMAAGGAAGGIWGGGLKAGATLALTAAVLAPGGSLHSADGGGSSTAHASAGPNGLELESIPGSPDAALAAKAVPRTAASGGGGGSSAVASDSNAAVASGGSGHAGGMHGVALEGQTHPPAGGGPLHGGGDAPGPGASASTADPRCGGDYGGAPAPDYSGAGDPTGPSDGAEYESPESAPPDEGGASVPEAQEPSPYDGSGTSIESPLPG